jgi:RimJ/RimL family protein N-acetyltransferase
MAPTPAVRLREVLPADLPLHFEQQRDPASMAMAAMPARDRAAFDAHWARLLADPSVVLRTVLADGEVAGSALCFVRDGQRQVGYWIAREHWGRGIATCALGLLLEEVAERPLHARVAAGNGASRRVLERCGFALVAEEGGAGVRLLVLRLD